MKLRSTAAVLVIAPALLVTTAGAASAGTTWSSLSSTAVTATQNGTTWNSISPSSTGIAYDHGRRHIHGDPRGKVPYRPVAKPVNVRKVWCNLTPFC